MDERYQGANDYDHYLRFAMAGAKFYHLPKVLYSVRHHGDNRKTGQHTEERYANLIQESKHCAWRARSWIEGDEERMMRKKLVQGEFPSIFRSGSHGQGLLCRD